MPNHAKAVTSHRLSLKGRRENGLLRRSESCRMRFKSKTVQTRFSSQYRWSTLALGLAGLCFVSVACTASGQAPVGEWDFVLTGDQHGVAQIRFDNDRTLSGTVVLTYFGRHALRTNHAFIYTNLFGSATLDGSWAYLSTNRIIGFINEVAEGDRSIVVTTNRITDEVTTNVVSVLVTNSLSFRAVAKPAKITLQAFGNQGTLTWKGIPLQPTNDLSGTYHATGKRLGQPFAFIEIFTLTSSGDVNGYDVAGGGPGHNYGGLFLASRQRYAAFAQSDAASTAYAGPFNLIKRRGSFKGTDGVPILHYFVSPEVP